MRDWRVISFRSGLILALAALASGASAQGVGAGLKPDAPVPAILQTPTYRLWPGRAPNATSDAPAETPTLTLFKPQANKANGTSVIIAPGGAYVGLAAMLEGTEPAAWFTAHGVTAFVLTYRVGGLARLPTPLLDGARAVRFVRSHAADFKLDPKWIGMMGFSAGGHLAASTAVDATDGLDAATDPVERVSSRPDFLVLAYPWLEATAIDAQGRSQYCTFARLGAKQPCVPKEFEGFAPIAKVDSRTPPTFIYHTTDDKLVPVQGPLKFYAALVAHKVPAEIHVFEPGDHGSGLGGSNPALSRWPDLLEAWLRLHALIPAS